ncbi:MAG: RHS repeat domain-containing protein, partial [Candidatus Methylomirabilaceae bacterium]
ITPNTQGAFQATTNRIVGNAYDSTGNQTAAGGGIFAYDAENRQKSVTVTGFSGTHTYEYDGEGRRVKRVVHGNTRVYVHNAQGQMVAEYNNGQLWKEFVYAGGKLLAIEDRNPITSSYINTDHLGSTRLVTNPSGDVESRHDYLPFGKEIPASLGGRSSVAGYTAAENILQRFTGKEVDPETGLQYFGARYFSGRQGLFYGAVHVKA